MIRSRLRRRVPVPRISTKRVTTRDLDFTAGYDSNTANDGMSAEKFRTIIDARMIEVGKWRTRQGNDYLSTAIGDAVNVQQTSTTGAGNFSFNNTTRFAKKIVATATGPLTSVEINIDNNSNTATGTIIVEVYSDNAGAPGTLLVTSSISASSVTSTKAYLKARTITCPTITNASTYWVVGYVQAGGSNSYRISTTTSASTGLSSTNSGQSWASASVDFNVKLNTATAGGVKGGALLQRPSGATSLFMAHDTSLYTVNTGTGVTTSIGSSISSSATRVRMAYVNDTVYYTTGFQKPRKYDFTTDTEVTGAPENVSNVIEHKGVLFYTSAVDTSKVVYTNFANYDTFTSTDFFYVPAPKTADPITAMFKLNGLLYINTRQNKYVLYGSENATFRLDNAVGQKGTFSQESVAWDEDNAYIASDDGIYRFNGAEEVNIAKDILKDYLAIPSKSNIVMELWKNRLYVWHTPVGGGENSRCFVYHTLYGVWESLDTLGYVSTAIARSTTDANMIVGSNRCGMLMYSEVDSNDYVSMGEPLSYKLHTHYNHYDTPAQFKRAMTYRPHFESVTGNYSVQVGYATDYSDSPTFTDLALQGSGPRFNTGVTFDSGAVFGGTQQINPMDSAPAIPGQWRRLQIRYEHISAREPVTFDGHALEIEVQRIK